MTKRASLTDDQKAAVADAPSYASELTLAFDLEGAPYPAEVPLNERIPEGYALEHLARESGPYMVQAFRNGLNDEQVEIALKWQHEDDNDKQWELTRRLKTSLVTSE